MPKTGEGPTDPRSLVLFDVVIADVDNLPYACRRAELIMSLYRAFPSQDDGARYADATATAA